MMHKSKKGIIVLVLTVLVVTFTTAYLNALSIDGQWSKQFNDGVDGGVFSDVIELIDGNFVAVGATKNTANGNSAFLVKTDITGNTIWQKTYTYDETKSYSFDTIEQTSDGGFIVGGHTNGIVPGEVSYGGVDAWIIKLDSNGNEQWSKKFGSINYDQVYGIVQKLDSSGYVVVGQLSTGWIMELDNNGSQTNQVISDESYYDIIINTAGNYVISGILYNNHFDGVIMELEPDLNVVWKKEYTSAGSFYDSLKEIVQAPDGGYVAAGFTQGTVTNGVQVGLMDGWILRVDSTGNEVWSKQYSATNTSTSSAFQAIDTTGDNTYLASGSSSGGGVSGFMLKVDSDGNEIWSFASDQYRNFYSTIVPSSGGYLGAGMSETITNPVLLKLNEQYILSFDLNGAAGPVPTSQNVFVDEIAIKPDSPTKEGHTFMVWNTVANGSGTTWDFATTQMPASDVTLYAQWSANPFQLNFNLNGAVGTPPVSQTVLFGELAIVPLEPTKEGYTFMGWNTVANGSGTAWDFTTMTMPANDVTLYAQWQVNTYEVVFELNEMSRSIWSTQQVVFGELLSEPVVPTLEGYTFMGWNTNQDGLGTTWDFTTMTMPANNITLYAMWQENEVVGNNVMSFDLNGGSGQVPPNQTLLEGGLAKRPFDPIREGYKFIGWNTQANGKGIVWDFTITQMPASNVVLYAQWQEDTVLLNPDNKLPETGISSQTTLIGVLMGMTGIILFKSKKKQS